MNASCYLIISDLPDDETMLCVNRLHFFAKLFTSKYPCIWIKLLLWFVEFSTVVELNLSDRCVWKIRHFIYFYLSSNPNVYQLYLTIWKCFEYCVHIHMIFCETGLEFQWISNKTTNREKSVREWCLRYRTFPVINHRWPNLLSSKQTTGYLLHEWDEIGYSANSTWALMLKQFSSVPWKLLLKAGHLVVLSFGEPGIHCRSGVLSNNDEQQMTIFPFAIHSFDLWLLRVTSSVDCFANIGLLEVIKLNLLKNSAWMRVTNQNEWWTIEYPWISIQQRAI